MNANLENYMNVGYNYIEGWVDPKLVYMIDHLNDIDINKTGGVAEIGIHHGRFFIMLNQLVSPQDKSYAIDIFDEQNLNIDKSGEGSLLAFLHNLNNYDANQGKNVIVVQGDSTDTSLELDKKIQNASIRFFSIDGGHTPQHTLNDLKIAERAVANQGVVIVDDILHPCWLGVLEGTLKYLDNFPNLVPFALGDNKLFLCKLSYKEKYYNHMLTFPRKNHSGYSLKFFGHDIVVFDA
jgi:hypothetical protein